jgi:serine/threonine protein kinase/tetratricopeptide (TPR) repeat protein
MNEPPSPEAVLFGEALALPADKRAAFLDDVCGENAELRCAVQVLLDAHDDAGAFLETAASGGRLLASAANPFLSAAESAMPAQKPGDRIGRYKLLEQIGEGGCGVVFMAEQEEPVRRRVALKIIKLGMDTKEVIARFEAERQALAMMDHSNIAKVLDAGATETGRPYFVMELVRGIKITEYCDQNNLTTKERLDLFSQVCRAIQHAHQKGIIHRDVKPSNILVTLHDGVPVPKVIDFGIAKATQGRLTDQTLFTAFQQFIGTPAYMSPEQAEMSGLDIDTRSDIYSLGVLLYELLTGKTPFDGKELLAAGVDAMRRTIREQEPPPPSTRLSTMLAGELTTTAKHRQVEPPRLVTSIRGDLDWIVMKCLEKDRTRRYETANGLATDVQRHLSNEAVLASPPSNLYRLRKVIRRNKGAFAAGVSVATALVIGLGIATWMYFEERAALQRATVAERKANEGEKKAYSEAARSEQVARLLKTMLRGVKPSVALGRDTALLKDLLNRTTDRLTKDLTNAPEVEAELRNIIGGVYGDLGDRQKSEEMHREALRLRKALFGETNVFIAESLYNLAWDLSQTRRHAEAEAVSRQALAVLKNRFGPRHVEVLDARVQLATILSEKGELADAEEMFRGVLRDLEREIEGGTAYEKRMRASFALENLGNTLGRQGKLSEGEEAHRQALQILTEILPPNDPNIAMPLLNLAVELGRQGKSAEAADTSRRALAIFEKLLDEDHPTVSLVRNNLAGDLKLLGKFAEAEALLWRVYHARTNRYGYYDAKVASQLDRLADLKRVQGKWAEAETIYRQVLTIQRKRNEPDLSRCVRGVAEMLVEQLKAAELEGFLRELVPSGQLQIADAPSLTARGEIYAIQSRWTEAMRDLSAAIELNPTNHWPYHGLASVLAWMGDAARHRELCQRIFAKFSNVRDAAAADPLAKDCLILPLPPEEVERVEPFVARAMQAHHQFAKALFKYRQGEFVEAIELSEKAAGVHIDWQRSRGLIRDYTVLAMAQFRLGRVEAARTSLAKAVELRDQHGTKPDWFGVETDGFEILFREVLFREAKALINVETNVVEKP